MSMEKATEKLKTLSLKEEIRLLNMAAAANSKELVELALELEPVISFESARPFFDWMIPDYDGRLDENRKSFIKEMLSKIGKEEFEKALITYVEEWDDSRVYHIIDCDPTETIPRLQAVWEAIKHKEFEMAEKLSDEAMRRIFKEMKDEKKDPDDAIICRPKLEEFLDLMSEIN